ncbi:MAG TPA: NusG domain II-containing protein, partial [Candidatus Cloacimonadota bacterium]|nr:NusG domain II-containing protein [Candidatus Cloacimonadota bacterium]
NLSRIKSKHFKIYQYIKDNLTMADLLLILFIIVSIISSFVIIKLQEPLNIIIVNCNNKILNEYDLSHDQIIKINDHNTIEIHNHKVRMLYSDCKNQQCVQIGWTDKMPIICVPNKLSISFKSKKHSSNNEMLITY